MPLGMEVGFSQEDFVLDRDPSTPPQKGAEPPKFSAHIYCDRTAGWIKMPLGMKVGFSQEDFVLDGDPSPPPQKGGGAPKFSVRIYCDRTAGWIKMALGMEVGFSPAGDFVLDGDPVPLPKTGVAPNFRPTSIVAKRLHGSRCRLVRR